ncbi:MAG: ATP-binding protein, partial [Armatimonadota bacterium]|nr:ATP-binding protein [Armatimonadota bacterium]
LTLAVEQFRDVEVGPTPHDEIDRLSLVYVQMSRRLRGQIQEIAEADEHRREMVSNVSHDLRTPLAALQGYLETLQMKEGDLTPIQQREYVQSALRHSERLAMLVEDLFELARLESREVQVHAEPFSLAELVQDVLQQHSLAAQKNGLLLEAGDGEDLPFVHADIGLIQRVLDNLIENAMRYTPPGGIISFALMLEGDKVRVQILDTGSGIRPEDLPHIFERFYRVPKQPDKPGCAGLGLAIAKRILELHDSNIHVESAPDQGTTFTFYLPTR